MTPRYKKEGLWVDRQKFTASEKLELMMALLMEETKMDSYETVKQKITKRYDE